MRENEREKKYIESQTSSSNVLVWRYKQFSDSQDDGSLQVQQ